MALDDPNLRELIISIRPQPRGLALEWRLLDHGPYPGPPPHPYRPPSPPVELDRGHELVDVALEGVTEGHLDSRTADVLLEAVGAAIAPAAAHGIAYRPSRISLELGPLHGAAIWWEEVVAERLRTGPAIVVRRGSCPITRGAVLPYDLRSGRLGPGIPADLTDVLDEWTLHRALPAGGLVLHDADYPGPVEILHLVVPPMTTDEPVSRLGPAEPPLLVGIWWQDRPDPGRLADILNGLLEARVGAVVVLATEDGQRATEFFRMLYRKVFHDSPIDDAVREAAERAGVGTADRLLVGANPGGETALLLSRAALRPAQHWLVAPSPSSTSRAERVSAELQANLGGRLRDTWDREGQPRWELLAHARFGDEEHDVAMTRSIAHEIGQLAPETSDALLGLRTVGADEVQKAATRLLQAWVDAGGARVEPGSPLKAGRRYDLSVQVAPQLLAGAVATTFPDKALAEVFRAKPEVTLDVSFFAVEDDVALEGPVRVPMHVPRFGAGSVAQVGFKPRREDHVRIRVIIAYRGVLLQSVVLEADAKSGLRLLVDYVASTDLALLDEHVQPVMSIFTNGAEDGSTHWVGVFAADDSVAQLLSGNPTVIPADDLERASTSLRGLLTALSGSGADYFYAEQFAADEAERQRRRGGLVSLAVEGYTRWDQLLGANSPAEQRASNPPDVLRRPGVVTIARCDRNATRSVPWAALYDFHLDDSGQRDEQGVPRDIVLCPEFDREIDTDPHFLDDPSACHRRPGCPLRDVARRSTTVCPFGFLGVRYQVEQPLQSVTPTPVGQVPPELLGSRFDQTNFLISGAAAGPKPSPASMALAVAPDLTDGDDHAGELQALNGLSITRRSDYADVIAALKQGGTHFQYFYCHGDVGTGDLRLRLGPADDPGWLSVGNLSDPGIAWPAEPRPLVFLNGCQTTAVTVETANKFLLAFRRLGASGVLGTEIEVYNVLARAVGTELLQRFLGGQSLGEALMAVRRGLLTARNPLGLAFTLFGPATLHLHNPAGCAWCTGHTATTEQVA